MFKISMNIRQFKRRLGRTLVGGNPQDLAWLLCRGYGLEVGARSNPYSFKNAVVKYADIANADGIKEAAQFSPRVGAFSKAERFVEVDFILNAPRYAFDEIQDNEFDFVFSDNVIEHTPNPIFSLIDQLRVVRPSGFVYGVIPNKRFTFDCERKSTGLARLVEKYHQNIFDHSMPEALDVIQNTVEYPDRGSDLNSQISAAKEMLARKDGVPHFHVFDEVNTLQMISFVCENASASVAHYSALQGKNIHFAIRKS